MASRSGGALLMARSRATGDGIRGRSPGDAPAARAKAAPARVVERARILLPSSEGVPGKQIAARVGCAEPTVGTWPLHRTGTGRARRLTAAGRAIADARGAALSNEARQ